MIMQVLSELKTRVETAGGLPLITPKINYAVSAYVSGLDAEEAEQLLSELPNGEPGPDEISIGWTPTQDYPSEEQSRLHWALCREIDRIAEHPLLSK